MKSNIFITAALVTVLMSCTEKKTIAADPEKDKDSVVSSTSDIKYKINSSRAIEAVIWGMPIVNSDLMFQAMSRAGGKQNEIVYWSGPSDWHNQTLTPNGDAIYFMPFVNTKDTGPMVLELPAAGPEGSIVGSYMDYWQMAIEDVGTAGIDKGRGGKFLILPPDYKAEVPAGYMPLKSLTYQSYALLRSIPKSTSEADTQAAVSYGKRIKLYPYYKAANPPQTILTDAKGKVFDATIKYDIRFFESLNNMVQIEPWLQRDKIMIDKLKTIGIEKGKAFAVNDNLKTMLANAAKDGKIWLADFYENHYEPHFSDAHWFLPGDPLLVKAMENSYSDPNQYAVDSRGCSYYCAFTSVKHMGAGQFYLFSSRDKDGKPLDGNKNYVLHVPANVPVKQYWSLSLYDFDTHAFIRDAAYPSRSSLNPALKKNPDGSVDVYLSAKAPAGKEGNWIPTKAGRRFEGLFRFYGPEKPIFDKSWKLPDIEEIK